MNAARSRVAAWLVHLYTASGAVCALLALRAVLLDDLRVAFAWLALQVAIDSTDGFFARLVQVKVVTPDLDGNRLDDIVDYLTYVFVPAVMVVHLALVPGWGGRAIAAAMLVSSSLGFSSAHAKTADYFFTGFPSYWNIVVLYLVAFRAPTVVSAVVLSVLVVLVFVPIRYIYPSRTPLFQRTTVALGAAWAAAMLVVIATLPEVSRTLLLASLVYPVYYVGLSLVLEARRPFARPTT